MVVVFLEGVVMGVDLFFKVFLELCFFLKKKQKQKVHYLFFLV